MSVVLAAPTAGAASTLMPRSNPEDRAMNAAALETAFDAAAALGHVSGMVVVRDGLVVGERHWSGPSDSMRQSRSVTKSVTSILIGIAMDKKLIGGIWDPVVDYLPARLVPADPAKRQIKIAHLLTMTSGLEWNEDEDVVAWLNGADPAADILGRRLVAAPGSRYNYSTAASHLLSVVLSEATGMSTLEFADAYLFGPLGISDRLWSQAGGYENGGHGLYVSTEDLAKLGVLFVNGGAWGGEQIVSRYWVNCSTWMNVRNVGSFGALTAIHYGFLWWLDRGTDFEIFTAWGYGGQFIFCVPQLKLVVATHSGSNVYKETADEQEAAILDIIVNRILPAVSDRRVFTATGRAVPSLAAVDRMMQDGMQEHSIQGAAVALVKDGRLVLARGYTWDEPDAEPVSPVAMTRIGSISKALTSVAVHQAIEQGLLDHDTLVAEILDLEPLPGHSVDPWWDEVTVDHLLTHTGGLHSEDDVYIVADVAAAANGVDGPCTKEELLSFIISQPFRFAPGSDWDYNNYGFIMLGMVLERLTGRPFVDLLDEQLFRPAGVGRARRPHTLEAELAPKELHYDGLEGDPYRPPMEIVAAAGGWVMAAPDLARVFSALFDDANASGLMSQATIEQMFELPFPVCEAVGYGRGWYDKSIFGSMGHSLGWLVDPDDGLEVRTHTGGGTGVHTAALWRSDNIVFVMLTNKDPVMENIDFPEIETWPDHDLWGEVGVSMKPVPVVPTEVWVPMVARAEGAGSSRWRSDLNLLNRSSLANSVRLRMVDDGVARDVELELAAGECRALDDVVGELVEAGAGPLRVFSSEPVTVGSRTYNEAAAGTFGQFIDAVAPTRALVGGDSVVLMQLREDATARSNIGILNGWKRPAVVEVVLHDAGGGIVATIEQEVPPQQTVQLNRPFWMSARRNDIASGYAVVNVLFGQEVVVYGSVIDNGTNDPTTIAMKSPLGSSLQRVAAAAHAEGANGSRWRSDVAVLNLGGGESSVRLSYVGDDGVVSTWEAAVAAGQQLLVEDVVAEVGGAGSGWVQVEAGTPVLVSSRTFNQTVDGSFGQLLDGLDATAVAVEGEMRWLPQLAQNESFRTNIGLVNTSDAETKVRVHLYDGAGVRLASPSRTLAPGQRVQLQEPFSRIAGRGDIGAGYATVEVREGSGVLAYASVIDNGTNDPTTIPARR